MHGMAGAMLVLVAVVGNEWRSEVPRHYFEMVSIAQNPGLTERQKINQIRTYFDKTDDWPMVVHWMAEVDSKAAEKAALEQSRRADLTRKQKLTIANAILRILAPVMSASSMPTS